MGGVISHTVVNASGVPQGSVLGPLLFSAYVSTITRLLSCFQVRHHAYADDTTLFIKFDPKLSPLSILSESTAALSNWFMHNGLLLNPSKSEVMWTGSRSQLQSTTNFSSDLKVAGTSVVPTSSVKIVGVTYDSQLTFNVHVAETCRIANFHLRALRHIRKFIDGPTANTVACCIVASRIDYCNSVLAGVSDYSLQRLQRVQNTAARIVCNATSRAPASPLLRQLHWLPVAHRIQYKIALITFKILAVKEPSYLFSFLTPLSSNRPDSSRQLRSSEQNLLSVPLAKSVLHSRAFSVFAPRLWNMLP